ncbi:MAG: hypothetical protein J5903_00125, partial [Clostridia bacterium]|nr:hypothetical protein [Clostridia bacterium]
MKKITVILTLLALAAATARPVAANAYEEVCGSIENTVVLVGFSDTPENYSPDEDRIGEYFGDGE